MTDNKKRRRDWMEMFFLLTEVILVGIGLLGITMLTNIWTAMVTASVLGIIAMEKALAANAARASAKLSKAAGR